MRLYQLALAAVVIAHTGTAFAQSYDPKTATLQQKAEVNASFLVSVSQECSKFKNDPAIYEKGTADAKAALIEAGVSESDADAQIAKLKKEAETALIKPVQGETACTVLPAK